MTSSRVPDRPALLPWCRLVEDDRRLLVEHGGTLVTFDGRAVRSFLPRLVALLDGSRTVDELIEILGRPVAPALGKALELLAESHLLVDGQPPSAADPAPAWYGTTVTPETSPSTASERLASRWVAVVGSGAAAREIVRQLRGVGVAGATHPEIGHAPRVNALVVAVPSQEEVRDLDALNRDRLARHEPWLQVLPYDGRLLVVGPLFLPWESACRECYVLRRAAASGYEDDYDRIELEPLRARPTMPHVSFGAALTVLQVIRWLVARDATLPGRFYALETAKLVRLSSHHVLRVPRCPACGPHETSTPAPWFEQAQ